MKHQNNWMDHIQIGVHKNVQVTLVLIPIRLYISCIVLRCLCLILVYQLNFGSHLDDWFSMQPMNFSRCVAVEHAEQTGSKTLFLTLLGGGAFGNPTEWITDAIVRAFKDCRVFRTGCCDGFLWSFSTSSSEDGT